MGEPVEVGRLSHNLPFIYSKWCRISEPSTVFIPSPLFSQSLSRPPEVKFRQKFFCFDHLKCVENKLLRFTYIPRTPPPIKDSMYFLVKIGIFQCHVSFQRCIWDYHFTMLQYQRLLNIDSPSSISM